MPSLQGGKIGKESVLRQLVSHPAIALTMGMALGRLEKYDAAAAHLRFIQMFECVSFNTGKWHPHKGPLPVLLHSTYKYLHI